MIHFYWSMEPIPVWQRNSPAAPPPAAAGRRFLFAGQAAKLTSKQKRGPSRKYAGASARRTSRCWSKLGSQWTSLAARHSGRCVRGQHQTCPAASGKGADINYHKPDMVFPNAPTAVTEAARHKNLPMVRWLIEQGADITIADKYGDRPYTVAVQNKNQELADYLKGPGTGGTAQRTGKEASAHAL